VYGKTFTTLWEGSMVGMADAQLVFIFLFCHCDREGFVEAHPAIVAAKTGIPIERVKSAIETLEAPDSDSRSKAEEGRRIVPLSQDHISGWKVVNYEYYRELRRADDRREYHRRYWHRRKLKQTQPDTTRLNPTQPIADADADAKAEAEEEAVPVVEVGRSSRIRSSEVFDRSAADAASAAFEDFYANYPRKEKKPKARTAFGKVQPSEYEALAAGLGRWKAYWTERNEPEFVPMPATFLNGRQWEDTPPRNGKSAKVSAATLYELGNRMKEAESGKG
jgi:hypothetical protein